jgi:hypothetical protein
LATVDVVIDFGIKAITKKDAKFIKCFEILLYPPVGYVSFFNDTDSEITVDIFNQDDAIRGVSYERRIVAPHQAALLAARGHSIHVHVVGHGKHKYDCDKGQAYLYDGENVYPKIS